MIQLQAFSIQHAQSAIPSELILTLLLMLEANAQV